MNKIASQKTNKLTQQKDTIGQHIPEGGGPASLGIHYQEILQLRTLDLQQVLYSRIPPNYGDPPYIYTYSLHPIKVKWLQQNETKSQMHGSTTNTNLIKAMVVNQWLLDMFE